MNVSQRHLARILVLKSFYAEEHGVDSTITTFESLVEDENLNDKNVKFARDLIQFVLENNAWADNMISEIAENWKLERIAAIDRIILKMALVELKIVVDTPAKVVINEAIELAKEYSTFESSRFINGILDRYLKDMSKKDKLEH